MFGQALAGKEYDLIYDCVGTPEDWPKASKVLKKGGQLQSNAHKLKLLDQDSTSQFLPNTSHLGAKKVRVMKASNLQPHEQLIG